MADKREILRETAKTMLPDSIITLAYVEHQMDLMAQLIVDMAESANLTGPALDRLNMLKQILEYTSIDFENLSQPLQAYKIPKTTEYKKNTRVVGEKYLLAQVREGVFGE
jgi:hypothetical protein